MSKDWSVRLTGWITYKITAVVHPITGWILKNPFLISPNLRRVHSPTKPPLKTTNQNPLQQVYLLSSKMAQVMDRGTDALKSHVSSTQQMTIRQTRKGWIQECLGCEAQTEFKYFVGDNQVAHSLEDSDFCMRCCCMGCHPFKMEVKVS